MCIEQEGIYIQVIRGRNLFVNPAGLIACPLPANLPPPSAAPPLNSPTSSPGRLGLMPKGAQPKIEKN